MLQYWGGVLKKKFVKFVVQDLTSGGLLGVWGKWMKHAKYIYNIQDFNPEGYMVDHMDNDGHNCCIDNLCFLIADENKAKGMTLDKMSADKSHIALSMFKDFETQLFQMTIVFNYPAKLILSDLEKPAAIELAFFLYDCEYEMVINDARAIMYDYRRDYTFAPEALHAIDYHIEGKYGTPIPVERFDEYQQVDCDHTVVFFVKKAPIKGWKKGENRQVCYLR